MHWKADMLLADAQHVCLIHFDLSQLALDSFESKKGPWKNVMKLKDRQYYRASYTIKVIVGAADLKFEVWYKGVLYGGEVVNVEWQ